MGYIEEIRRMVGHQPILMVGASILLVDDQDRLLLMLRSDNQQWGIPGGAMEPGESAEETARRETFEEVGLLVQDLTLFNVFSGPDLYYRYPNGDEVYNITIVYCARYTGGALKLNPTEHSRLQFFDLDRLPEEISPPLVKVIAAFRQFVKKNGSQARAMV